MEFCSKVKQNNIQTNLKRWDKISYRGYTIRIIHYFAKLDKKDSYFELFQQHKMRDMFDDTEDNVIEIDDRYLLHKTKLLKDNSKLCQVIEDFLKTEASKPFLYDHPMTQERLN